MPHPRAPQYVAVIKDRDKPNVQVVLHRLDLRNSASCITYRKYKGTRIPTCLCLPCLETLPGHLRTARPHRAPHGARLNHRLPAAGAAGAPTGDRPAW